MPRGILDEKLHLFDFETESSASGLLFTDRDYRKDSAVSFDEILVLHRAKDLRADAVYFRRMEGRSSIPQLLVFDNSDGKLSTDKLIDVHRKIWSSGIVPLYYVFDKTEVRIFNCRKSINRRTLRARELASLPFEEESLFCVADVHAEYKKYSAKLFENGSFWEAEENKRHFNINGSSYKKLIEGLKKIRNEFAQGENEEACNKLLVLSIFVKYLEERKDSKDKRVLPQDYFQRYDGATCFCDILRKGKCIRFFEDLGKKVNGKIFRLTSHEKKQITSIDLAKLADFLDAELDNYQYVMWPLYDFNYLPVELISRIYEEFVPNRKDITYTPAHLASFMVDECMPLSRAQKSFRLIDGSCGSGIFLVAAFKRIVQWWQKEQYEKTGKIVRPKIGRLKSILARSIHGVDLEGEAVRLTIFSLTVALCDMLDPTMMWEQLTEEKLGDLSNNIITQDFFDFLKTDKKFDLVIGNPPFNLPVTEKEDREKKKKEQEKYWRGVTHKVEFDYEIPDKSIALAFLQQAMKLLRKNGLLSLVMPSGPLLYNKTLGYRAHFLSRYNVPQIFDFSSLANILFEGRNYPVAVLFAQNAAPDNNDILHVAVRRTKTAKEKLYFEIDKYDLYYVPKEVATTEQLIWKANILGGGHLFSLVKRTQGLRTLGRYLKDKKKGHGWFYGEGYSYGNRSNRAPHLTGKDMIPTDKFKSNTINDCDIEPEGETLFERTRERNKLIFVAPHILIKKSSSLPTAFMDYDLIFRKEIVGIHAPEDEKRQLIQLRQNITANKKLYGMLLLSGSGRAGISRSVTTILKKDIMSLPYPDSRNELKLSKAEQIVCDDVLKYGIKQLSQGEEASVNTEEAKKHTIEAFARVFCTSLNSIYEEGAKQFYPLEHIESLSYICVPFIYGNPERPKRISLATRSQVEKGNLDSLLDNPQGKNVLYKRTIKLTGKNWVYLIKPKKLRYWLKSIALRDASEVFTDLVSSGY